jgi:hypothetical protein
MMLESVSDLNISKTNCCQAGKSSTIRIFVQGIASFRILQKLCGKGRAKQSQFCFRNLCFHVHACDVAAPGQSTSCPGAMKFGAVKGKMVILYT